jgi:Zn-dependent protease
MIDGIFYIVILIMSVVIHEFAHGYVAYRLGDMTARMSGRLTLNPIKHLDLFGSIILPLILIFSNTGFVIGWAKPVPYNPNNLRNGKKGDMMVAIAGILANLLLVIIFSLIIRLAPLIGISPYDMYSPDPFYKITSIIVLLNLVLAFFNLIPVPPLDGSKIIFSFLPPRLAHIQNLLEKWGIFLMLFVIFFLWQYITPAIFFIFKILTGL